MAYTLLLADASVTIQRIIELTFASEDIEVVAFSDGDHAMASLDRRIPDIVLADIGLPGPSGYELARYIKNSPPLAHIPVLLLTGAFEPVDQAKALEAGCDGILIKPFEPQFVVSRVKELLRKPRPGSKEDEVEQYFEELDKAFANLSASPPPLPAVETPMSDSIEVVADVPAESPASAPVEFSASTPVELSGSTPVEHSGTTPVEHFVSTSIEPAASTPDDSARSTQVDRPASTTPESPADAAAVARPSLADAFAALLAAERSANGTKRPTPTLVSSSRLVPNDDVIERVTRRVLEQLSDVVVRQTVTDIVQATAERLVREEIERIKSNIK